MPFMTIRKTIVVGGESPKKRRPMAVQVRVVTKEEKKAKQRASFKIVCKGASKKEFFELCSVFRDNFGCGIVLRNPTPAFDANAVHQIIFHLTGSALGVYAGKAVIDVAKELFVAYIKFRYLTTADEEHPRRITLYGPNDKVLYEIKKKKPNKKAR